MTQEIYFAGEHSQGLGFYAIRESDGEPSEYYPTRKACRAAVEDGSAWVEQFSLAAQPATVAKRPEPIRNNERKLQRVLLTGLDCLSGQNELFNTDGAI